MDKEKMVAAKLQLRSDPGLSEILRGIEKALSILGNFPKKVKTKKSMNLSVFTISLLK